MKPAPALDVPGPGSILPNRFAVRTAGGSGLKITGSNYKQPIHFLSKHSSTRDSLRCSLHESAHKKDNSPAMVSVHKHQQRNSGWTTTTTIGNVKLTSTPARGPDNYQIILHRKDGNNECIDMPQTSHDVNQFRMRMNGREEVFEWVKGSAFTQELKTICKRESPAVKTGMPREKAGRVGMGGGYILVRVTGRSVQPRGKKGEDTPLGYDKSGREIVASWAYARGWGWGGPVFFFQWWGSGATGELGEDFTRVAATTGAALYHEEALKAAERQRRQNSSLHNNNRRRR
ncbi:hypothetical protein QBC40DRAFT_289359 [Triangularia verruculosa]|uniref:Uncharacterized protein n=1 Tax=Triangularia verruculosa TaxID=2587418 RepID=A0AAN7AQZ4_9PEZI|nr:hypothetical protein QBC40DRAFT_289359 [Triangularia verruculosa]